MTHTWNYFLCCSCLYCPIVAISTILASRVKCLLKFNLFCHILLAQLILKTGRETEVTSVSFQSVAFQINVALNY